MAQKIFEQDIYIAAPPEKVKTFLTSLHNHRQIHPLIVDIQLVETPITHADGSLVSHYRVRDRIPLGPFTISVTYSVTMQITANGDLNSTAAQFPAVYLFNTTKCSVEGDGTRVSEYIKIQAPALLMGTTYKQASQSHVQMFQRLKQLLENASNDD
ncbi:SRPBCC family protein [Dictyobacter kobayashii]|uniref:Polyketide cyclase / dehydrase and lipid transport n=1 Tax=Dictyobacter kobayashii TaxID=2014872 RepID=A0A402AWE0_9CHLR|nr:SRPBCC family protein [Dictyobacter kobayashii]GCE23399.1 hypothetical protein KDK_71990 [Dictyobacter kobayashii]